MQMMEWSLNGPKRERDTLLDDPRKSLGLILINKYEVGMEFEKEAAIR
jgi:hypothetical protein